MMVFCLQAAAAAAGGGGSLLIWFGVCFAGAVRCFAVVLRFSGVGLAVTMQLVAC
jgi:hypothetical protein